MNPIILRRLLVTAGLMFGIQACGPDAEGAVSADTASKSSMQAPNENRACPAAIAEDLDYDKDGIADACDVIVILAKDGEVDGLSLELSAGAPQKDVMIADIHNQTSAPIYWSLVLDEQHGVTPSVRNGWIAPGGSQTIALDIDQSAARPGSSIRQVATLQVADEVHQIPLSITTPAAPPSALVGMCTYSVYVDSIKVVKGQGRLEGALEVELTTNLQTVSGVVTSRSPTMNIPVKGTHPINSLAYTQTTPTGTSVGIPVNFMVREFDGTSGDDTGSADNYLSFDCSEGTSRDTITTHIDDSAGGQYEVTVSALRTGN
jgi:hypothetical protein